MMRLVKGSLASAGALSAFYALAAQTGTAPVVAGDFQPGLWKLDETIIDMDVSGKNLPNNFVDQMRSRIKSKVGQKSSKEICITPQDVAEQMPSLLGVASDGGVCNGAREAGDGRLKATTTCGKRGLLTVTGEAEGTYDQSSLEMRVQTITSGDKPFSIVGTAQITGTRLGDCPAAASAL